MNEVTALRQIIGIAFCFLAFIFFVTRALLEKHQENLIKKLLEDK